MRIATIAHTAMMPPLAIGSNRNKKLALYKRAQIIG